MTARLRDSIAALISLLAVASFGESADWPQFLRSAARTGDAADESLQLPLGLAARIPLEDAILSSPAVVEGRVYVVDQMGTAYYIDPTAGRIVWKSAPEKQAAMGGNTSSPAVHQGKVYFATTAGGFHVLDARDGSAIRSTKLDGPVTGSVAIANDRVYLQSLGAIIYCFDLDGKEVWRWDHYASYVDPKTNPHAQGFPGSFHDPHYSVGEVAVSGKRVVANMGWDLVALDDAGNAPKLAWCNRAPLGKDPGIPMGPSICGEWIYIGHPGTDQFGGMMRCRLDTGKFDPKKDFRESGYPGSIWAVFATPAVRGETAFVPTHYHGVFAYDFAGAKRLWAARGDNSYDQRRFTSSLASPALAGDHCVIATVQGEVHVVDLKSKGEWPKFQPAPYTYRTPSGKPIASSPVIVGGKIYFGSDDGCLYILGPGKDQAGLAAAPQLNAVRSKIAPATGKKYGAPVGSVDQGNTSRVDDPKLLPPFRVRWAMRPFDLRVQISADDDSLYFISEAGTLAALEQATGRLRWRQRLNGPVDGWKQILLDRGRIYVTRNGHGRPRAAEDGGASLAAYSAADGSRLWQRPWGTLQGTCRTSPVIVGDVVAGITSEGDPAKMVALAFDAISGEPRWRIELPADAKTQAGGACVLDGVMFFSCGQTWGGGTGSTIAVDPAKGEVLWTNREHHIHGYGRPAARDGRLYLGGQSDTAMFCLNAKDGALIWKADKISYSHSPSLGDKYFVTRSYGADGILRDIDSGKPLTRNGRSIQGGCPDHACSPVLLSTGNLSFAVSSSGLYVRDLETEKILWQSRGFAPRACTTPVAANGRLFYSPNVNNLLFCFEPEGSE